MSNCIYIITDVVDIIDTSNGSVRTTVNIGPVYEDKTKADAFIDEIKKINRAMLEEERYDVIEESYKQASYYKFAIKPHDSDQLHKHNYIIKKRTITN